MQHHTKEKGDLAVAMVIADMKKHGIGLCLPISEHMPFDLVAVDTENGYALRKIQVKYQSQNRNAVRLNLQSSYADRHGVYFKTVDRTSYDAYAIYCPDTDMVYYIKCHEIPENQRVTFSFRVIIPKNGQKKGIRWAKDYLGVRRIFE